MSPSADADADVDIDISGSNFSPNSGTILSTVSSAVSNTSLSPSFAYTQHSINSNLTNNDYETNKNSAVKLTTFKLKQKQKHSSSSNTHNMREKRRNISRIMTRAKSYSSRTEQVDAGRNFAANNTATSTDNNNNNNDNNDNMDIIEIHSDDDTANIAVPVARANATLGLPPQPPPPPPLTTTTNQTNATRASLPRVPQIWINHSGDFLELTRQINKIIPSTGYTIKIGGPNLLRFHCESADFYRSLIRFFNSKNIQYHTYQPRTERSIRIVIRGIHFSTPIERIKDELTKLEFSVRSVYLPVFKNKTGTGLFSPNLHFIELEPNGTNNSKIFDIATLCQYSVRVEWRKRAGSLVQCRRCQKYNHTGNYCHREPVCVKCGLKHLTKDCQKSNMIPAKCGNCSGNHTANFGGCPYLLKLLNSKLQSQKQRQRQIKSQSQSQSQTKTQQTTKLQEQQQKQQKQQQQRNVSQANRRQRPQSQPQQQQQKEPNLNTKEYQELININISDQTATNHYPLIVKVLQKHSEAIADIQTQMRTILEILNRTPTPTSIPTPTPTSG